MAFRTFDQTDISRRSLFRGGGYLAAGAALSTLPFGRELLAHDVSEAWPNVAAMTEKYLSERKVPNLFLTFGWGQNDMAHTVGGGTLGFGNSREAVPLVTMLLKQASRISQKKNLQPSPCRSLLGMSKGRSPRLLALSKTSSHRSTR